MRFLEIATDPGMDQSQRRASATEPKPAAYNATLRARKAERKFRNGRRGIFADNHQLRDGHNQRRVQARLMSADRTRSKATSRSDHRKSTGKSVDLRLSPS